MSVSEERKAFMREIAWEVGDQIGRRLENRMAEMETRLDTQMVERIEAHAAGCGHGKTMTKVAIVFAALGGVVVGLLNWLTKPGGR